jgi:hypothetical protein
MEYEIYRQIVETYSNIKFNENPSSGSRVVPCERTDMTKLIVVFLNFANKSTKEYQWREGGVIWIPHQLYYLLAITATKSV